MRAIARLSIDHERNGALRNKLYAVFRRHGFHRRRNTATYETTNIDEAGLSAALGDFWNAATTHDGPGRIDHFWMHIDRAAADE
jgi:hypothetical protein